MGDFLLSLGLGIALTAATAAGDFFIKSASEKAGLTGWRPLLLGALIWAATAFGWFYLMKKFKLSTLGVLYSVGIVVLLTALSVFWFKEKISPVEIFAIALAIISLLILFRFA